MNKRQFEDNQADNAPKEKEEKRHFFSDLSAFFDSVTSMLSELGGGDRELPPPITATQTVRPLKKHTHLVHGAEGCKEHLTKLKEALKMEFGVSCSQFIAKSIDPMLRHIDAIIMRLQNSDGSPSLEEEAIRSVGLYSEFKDERKMRRKIVAEAVQASQEAITKDCQILINYQHHAERTHPHIGNALLMQSLEPLFQAFHELHQTYFESEDIRAFFIWKSSIDERRAELSEKGFQLIDAYFAPPKSKREKEAVSIFQELDDEPHEAEYYS